VLAYTYSSKGVLASPKLYAGSKRSVQATQWHFAFAVTKDPFCLSVFNTAQNHCPTLTDSASHTLPRFRLIGGEEGTGRWMHDCCRRIQ